MILSSLADAKLHLKMDTDDLDTDIQGKLEAVSLVIADYMGYDIADPLLFGPDTAGDPVGVPAYMKQAALLWLGLLFRHRDGGSDNAAEFGQLPREVSRLLYYFRGPGYA